MSRSVEAARRAIAGEDVRKLAAEYELSTAAIYMAKRREMMREVCPCCGTTVDKRKINREVLKNG